MFLEQLVFIVSVIAAQTSRRKLTSVVEIHSGPIQGEILENVLNQAEYSAFKGIPYAEPPLGRYRFQPPVDPMPWSTVLPAVDDGNVCPQKNGKNIIGSENCLVLNVYVPSIHFDVSNDKFAVIVFIHGGAYARGHASSNKYGPDFLIDKDVILVTFNYRLGPIGFLNVLDSRISSNNGLKDQNFALRWVQKNIAKFGGDPDNVTLMGQSAGGASVDLHLISDLSRGLYKKSIAMSGSVFSPWAFHKAERARKSAFKLGKKINNDKKVKTVDHLVTLLQDVSFRKLVDKSSSVLSLSEKLKYQLPFGPSIENPHLNDRVFIDECFVKRFESGQFNNGPHMLGFTNMEAAASMTHIPNSVVNTFDTVVGWFQPSSKNKSESFLNSLIKTNSEIVFSTGIDLKQQYMVEYGDSDSIYYYYFTYDHLSSPGRRVKGAKHGDDLIYVFYMPHKNQSLDHFDSEQSEINASKAAIVRNRFVTMLTNFAKFSNPTPTFDSSHNILKSTWEKSDKSGSYLEIGNELIMHSHKRPVSEKVLIWEKEYRNQYSNNVCVPFAKKIMKQA